MYLSIKSVSYYQDYKVLLTFENNEQRLFDVAPYLDLGIFNELKDLDNFKTVHVCFDTIEWANGVDLDPEILYQDSVKNCHAS